VARLDEAFALVTETQPIRERLRKARVKDWRNAAENLLSAAERGRLEATDEAIEAVIAVDDFAAGDLLPDAQ
jgi:acyl-CoA dehydrogenase